MKSFIRKLLREGLDDKVVLKSKSAKGNRLFDMLKTAKFQHYDMPKGELSDFSYGEDDRKRLVSKLSKADKKTYREWLKTPEGEKSMEIWDKITASWNKRFPNSKKNKINESKTIVDKYGDTLKTQKGWGDLDFSVPEYKTKVKDAMVEILVKVNQISEKDFKRYDKAINAVREFFLSKPELLEMMLEYEGQETRPEYVAEEIYNKYRLKV